MNATTSICDSDASISFRHFFSKEIPVAIFIGSDGVDDSFQNDEQLYNLYKSILFSFGTDDFESAKKELEDYLPKLSKKGSGDDISIAAVLDMDKISESKILEEFIVKKSESTEENIIKNTEERNEN